MGRWDAVSTLESPVESKGLLSETQKRPRRSAFSIISMDSGGMEHQSQRFKYSSLLRWLGDSPSLQQFLLSKLWRFIYMQSSREQGVFVTAAKWQRNFSAAEPWQAGTRTSPLRQLLTVYPLQPDPVYSDMTAFTPTTPGSNITGYIQPYRDGKTERKRVLKTLRRKSYLHTAYQWSS